MNDALDRHDEQRKSKPPCKYEGCDRPHKARGWCRSQYERWLRHGDPKPLRIMVTGSLEERFWARTDRRGPDDCWNWTGCTQTRSDGMQGYGFISKWNGKRNQNALAHRVAYEIQVGPIPEGMTIDHRCLNKLCQNAAHFDLVTAGENARRGYYEVRADIPLPKKDARGKWMPNSAA